MDSSTPKFYVSDVSDNFSDMVKDVSNGVKDLEILDSDDGEDSGSEDYSYEDRYMHWNEPCAMCDIKDHTKGQHAMDTKWEIRRRKNISTIPTHTGMFDNPDPKYTDCVLCLLSTRWCVACRKYMCFLHQRPRCQICYDRVLDYMCNHCGGIKMHKKCVKTPVCLANSMHINDPISFQYAYYCDSCKHECLHIDCTESTCDVVKK